MKLNQEQIKENLKDFSGWEIKDEIIEKTFEFPDFSKALDFVNQVAGFAKAANHHPDIEIKYSKVKITLSTHDENGVTEKDISLAQKIEKLIK